MLVAPPSQSASTTLTRPVWHCHTCGTRHSRTSHGVCTWNRADTRTAHHQWNCAGRAAVQVWNRSCAIPSVHELFFSKRHIVSNAAMVSTGTSAIASLQCDTWTEQLRHKMKPWNAPPRMRKPLWMANPAPLHVATWLECSGEDANLETGGQAKSLICTGATPDTLQVGDTQV